MGLLSSIKQRRAAKAKGPKAEMHPITVRDEPLKFIGGSSRTVMGCILLSFSYSAAHLLKVYHGTSSWSVSLLTGINSSRTNLAAESLNCPL